MTKTGIKLTRREFGHKEAEAGGKVEGLADFDIEVLEADVLSIVWQNAMIGHGV